ncbi:MAG: aminotransferase class I/II-fold pyridoxal phosphate-dependent enzyme [Acidimicrobiaceae bacterium]|nr:aminotransferase class I/II-fold pyridoxal phosphate-dependent enzyme [Acidimicrobiaceae bacterium]MYH43363.1 aminotransferase class I/II-fold pyridoxal phosphate-dependent enzyme [Acidimicrobiaceae bacterium]MYJ40952.1 aminotransferase class I/II-fold pyridoxal phosphate-dependent enzyme [Acidimicrobiaceae bacterium]
MTALGGDARLGDFDARFDAGLKRGNRNAKWTKHGPEALPAWVAEHDFRPPPGVLDAMRATIDRGDFGYHDLEDDAGAAFARWAGERYGWSPDPEFVHTCVDVLQGVTAAITALAGPGEGVILTPPIYHIFLQICPTARRRQLEWLMRHDREAGWTLDPDDLEDLVRREPDARVLLWCHPHNPTGWVPGAEVLQQVVDLAHAYDFYVVSDEIHADLVYADSAAPFTPMLAIPGAAERVVTITSPAKTFALSGLRCAVMAYGDRNLRRSVRQAHPPLLLGHAARTGIDAAVAAWRHGAAWADGLVAHLAELRDHLTARLSAEAPEVVLHRPDSTFLAWLDVSACGLGKAPAARLLHDAGVALSEGTEFGTNGDGHVRLNFGTSMTVLDEVLDRLAPCLRAWRPRG